MKFLLKSIFIILLFASQLNAQTPQIVVVKPNGTSAVFNTFQDAYDYSVNGDYVYLPGGNFPIGNTIINKGIHILGAGIDQDSSSVTGITTTGSIIISNGASNGSLEGLNINNGPYQSSIIITPNSNTEPISNFIISNCQINMGITISQSSNGLNCSLFTIKNNLIIPSNGNSLIGQLTNSIISNNKILGSANLSGGGNTFSNNLFFNPTSLSYYSTYQNNIFPFNYLTSGFTNTNNSLFNNNMNCWLNGTQNNTGINNIEETWTAIFENSNSSNYHVKSTSLAHNSGTDGTDRGIYGGAFPWKDGQIPSNPHIFYKQIAPTTAADGKINVHVKVRTNN